MKVDAWEESPPVAPTKIRAFLAESGLSLKPAFCIIKAVDEAPDPESESDLALPPPPAGSLIADDEDGEESSEPSGLSSSGTERSRVRLKGTMKRWSDLNNALRCSCRRSNRLRMLQRVNWLNPN